MTQVTSPVTLSDELVERVARAIYAADEPEQRLVDRFWRDFIPAARAAIATLEDRCKHESVSIGYDHITCLECGWVRPDTVVKSGTAATWDEWFPSMDAFAHFKRTGVRAWLNRTTPESDKEGASREG